MPEGKDSARPFSATFQRDFEPLSYSARPEPAATVGDNRKQNYTNANTRNSVLWISKLWAK